MGPEPRLGLLVGKRVQRPRLLRRQLQAAQGPRQAGWVQPLVEATLNPAAEHRQGPIGAAVLGVVRPAEDRVQEQRLLDFAQCRGSPCLGLVAQPIQPLGILADHRIPRRLPLHARQARRLSPAHALERAGNRQHARRRPRVPFPMRQRRSRAGLASSVRISSAAPIGPPASSHPKGITATVAAGSKASQNLSAAV